MTNHAGDGLPLQRGARGEAVRDLHQRLAAVGFDAGDDPACFGERTRHAIHDFQQHRGLVADGICGQDTWAALVEAGYHLGDRLLYLRRPMLRGDDVAELQHKLGSLGFDSGVIDGIFGPKTERALKDFQRNAGLTTDGVSGPDVLAGLARLGSMADAPVSVAGIRERERLAQAPRELLDRRVVLGDLGGLDVAVSALARTLQQAGAIVVTLDHPDRSIQASTANEFAADLYLGLSVSAEPHCYVAYYSTKGFESLGGRRLAELVAEDFPTSLAIERPRAQGMRLGVLRETRMPAVVCQLTPVDAVVEHHPEIARALATSIARWIAAPLAV